MYNFRRNQIYQARDNDWSSRSKYLATGVGMAANAAYGYYMNRPAPKRKIKKKKRVQWSLRARGRRRQLALPAPPRRLMIAPPTVGGVTPTNVGRKRRASAPPVHSRKRLRFDNDDSQATRPRSVKMPYKKARRSMRKRRPVRRGRKPARRTARPRALKNATGYAGRFKKAKGISASAGMLHGSVRKFEDGGLRQDDKCVYVGHSSAQYVIEHTAVWETVVRHLLRERGVFITSMIQVIDPEYVFVLYWRTSALATTAAATIPITGGTTVSAIATALARTLYTQVANVGGNAHLDFLVDKLVLEKSDSGTPVTAEVAAINLRTFMIDLKVESVIRIQNQTVAIGGVDAANSNEVTNNPLVGKMYHGEKGGFEVIDRIEGATPTWKSFLPDDYGRIGAIGNAGQDGNREALPAFLSKPPNPNFFKYCKKYTRVYLAPGQIKSSKLMHFYKGEFSKWLKSQRRLIAQAGVVNFFTSGPPMFQYRGKSVLFGLERQLDTRLNTEPVISVGYQINGRVSCAGSQRKNSAIPETVVDINKDAP